MMTRWCLVAACVLGLAVPAEAQLGQPGQPGQMGRNNRNGRNREMQQQMPRGERVEASGTIENIASGAFQGKTAAGEMWVFRVAQNSSIRVVGHAKTDFLKPGMLIQFTAQVDTKKNEVVGEVSKLTIFTPYAQKMPGVYPESSFPGEGGQPGAGGPPKAGGPPAEKPPGFGQVPSGFGEKQPGDNDMHAPGDRPAGRRAGKSPQQNLEGQNLLIGGQIASIKGEGRVTLNVPNLSPKLRVQIAEDAEIDVDVAELSLARPGARIDLVGMMFQPGMGQISEANIELAEPLAGSAKRKPSSRAHAEAKEEAKEEAEAPETSEDAPAKDGKQE